MPSIDTLLKEKKKFRPTKFRAWTYNEDLSKGYQDDGKRLSKGYQDDDKRLSKEVDVKFISNQILQLTGYQKTIFEFIIRQIKISNDLTSNPISNTEMLTKTNISPVLVKLSINRLFSKKLLEKHNLSKNGRNGFRIFKINAKVKKASSIIFNNNDSLEEKVINDNSPSSSSNNNKTTTTIKEEIINLEKTILNSEDSKNENLFSAEWKKINYAPLENIGFNTSHLKDIQETNLSDPEVVQESIYHFAFGLENNKEKYKDYKNPLNVLIGRLRKGKGWFESNYESEKDKALKELVLIKKRQETEKKKLIQEIAEIEFPKWRSKLTQEEIEEIVPSVALQLGENTIDTVLRCHFEAEVLPKNLEQHTL